MPRVCACTAEASFHCFLRLRTLGIIEWSSGPFIMAVGVQGRNMSGSTWIERFWGEEELWMTDERAARWRRKMSPFSPRPPRRKKEKKKQEAKRPRKENLPSESWPREILPFSPTVMVSCTTWPLGKVPLHVLSSRTVVPNFFPYWVHWRPRLTAMCCEYFILYSIHVNTTDGLWY